MSSREKVIDRVRKLLALSRSSNPHEAAVAAARAAALMTEHEIAAASLEERAEPEPIGEHCLDRSQRRVSWKLVLASGVAAGFGCSSFHRARRDAPDETIVVGRSSDVATVGYMYAYLVREIDRLAAEGWAARAAERMWGESARSWKNAFRVGAAVEVAARLRASRAEVIERARARAGDETATRQALVRVDEHAGRLAEYLARLGLGRGRRISLSSGSGLAQGKVAGGEVNLGGNPGLGRPARQLGGGG